MFGFGIVKKKGLRKMNTHNDFLDNAVNDELEMVCIGDLTTDVCSDMQNDTEKMCLSLQNATHRKCCINITHYYMKKGYKKLYIIKIYTNNSDIIIMYFCKNRIINSF